MNYLVEQKKCVQILLEDESMLITDLIPIQALYDAGKITKM